MDPAFPWKENRAKVKDLFDETRHFNALLNLSRQQNRQVKGQWTKTMHLTWRLRVWLSFMYLSCSSGITGCLLRVTAGAAAAAFFALFTAKCGNIAFDWCCNWVESISHCHHTDHIGFASHRQAHLWLSTRTFWWWKLDERKVTLLTLFVHVFVQGASEFGRKFLLNDRERRGLLQEVGHFSLSDSTQRQQSLNLLSVLQLTNLTNQVPVCTSLELVNLVRTNISSNNETKYGIERYAKRCREKISHLDSKYLLVAKLRVENKQGQIKEHFMALKKCFSSAHKPEWRRAQCVLRRWPEGKQAHLNCVTERQCMKRAHIKRCRLLQPRCWRPHLEPIVFRVQPEDVFALLEQVDLHVTQRLL